ncbi:DUF4388 domain-containing protein [Desulfomarina sp.]
MKAINWFFSIVDQKNCPLYEVGEKLILSEKTLSCPDGKEVCLILVRDMTQLLFQLLDDTSAGGTLPEDKVFNCSGCTGLIKFSPSAEKDSKSSLTGTEAVVGSVLKAIFSKIGASPFLKALPTDQIEEILAHFREITLMEGAVLIRKGEQNFNLYLIVEGEFQVEDEAVVLGVLKTGELCGEMSYLGADVAVSTVRAVKKSKVLAIEGDVFGRLLGNNGSVQAFVAKLLAGRLRKSNAARSRDFEACMSGRLDQIVPAELFQIFHMHQKTGVLTMELPEGEGKVAFREGCLINASYAGEKNQEAIFKILGENKGLYRFTTGLSPRDMKAAEIGDFMMLLMEGVKRVDEDLENGDS